METGWPDLTAELDRWGEAGRTVTLWWRDDDATAPSADLDRLIGLSDTFAVPLALAVIPATCTPELAAEVAAHPLVQVLQHGCAHQDNSLPAAPGKRRKKIELGGSRDIDDLAGDLSNGRARLTDLFGDRFVPALVPPWNRIAPALVERLPALGFTGLSTFGPRTPVPGLAVANTHVDVIDWRGTRGFVGNAAALGALTGHLRDRRTGVVDANEPTGLMTHHLDHDEATWAFIEALLSAMVGHPAACCVAPDVIFRAPGDS